MKLMSVVITSLLLLALMVQVFAFKSHAMQPSMTGAIEKATKAEMLEAPLNGK